MNDRQFLNLLRRAASISEQHNQIQQKLTEAFEKRYGTTYSDVNCDEIIDILDYGGGHFTSSDAVDEMMAKCGAPKLKDAP